MEIQSKQTRQEKMFSLIETWQESGLSKKQFCAEQNIPQPVFYYWMKKYRASFSPTPEGFVPVFVEAEVSDSTQSLEIRYPNGVRLVLPSGSDLNTIRSLIGLM